MDKIDKYLNEEKISIDKCIVLLNLLSKTAKKGVVTMKKFKKNGGDNVIGNQAIIKQIERDVKMMIHDLNNTLYGM